MPIFLSHKMQDSGIAKRIYNQLKIMNIEVYLDVMDGDIHYASDLTQHILTRLNSCTHMLAIFSACTRDSWWVPFEIGAALNTGHRIASYSVDNIDLPEYMHVWPVLKALDHVSIYGDLYRQDQVVVGNEGYVLESAYLDEALSATAKRRVFEGQKQFHEELKDKIKSYTSHR